MSFSGHLFSGLFLCRIHESWPLLLKSHFWISALLLSVRRHRPSLLRAASSENACSMNEEWMEKRVVYFRDKFLFCYTSFWSQSFNNASCHLIIFLKNIVHKTVVWFSSTYLSMGSRNQSVRSIKINSCFSLEYLFIWVGRIKELSIFIFFSFYDGLLSILCFFSRFIKLKKLVGSLLVKSSFVF